MPGIVIQMSLRQLWCYWALGKQGLELHLTKFQEIVPGLLAQVGFRQQWLGLREQCLEVAQLGFRRKCLEYWLCWVLGDSPWNSSTAGFQAIKGVVGPKEIVPGIQALLGSRESGHCWTLGESAQNRGSCGFQRNRCALGHQGIVPAIVANLGFREQCHCWALGKRGSAVF